MVSLKKEPRVREYTPEHLMNEEEAVRRLCPPRESAAKADSVEIRVEKEHGEIVTLDEADNLPTEESNSKPKRSREILMLVVQIICFLGSFASMFAGVERGVQAILTNNSLSLSVIAEVLPFAVISASISCIPTLIRMLLNCRR